MSAASTVTGWGGAVTDHGLETTGVASTTAHAGITGVPVRGMRGTVTTYGVGENGASLVDSLPYAIAPMPFLVYK